MLFLNVEHVSKRYGSHQVIDDVSFTFNEGDNIALIGGSGSGKTSLAKLIMGIITPDQGRIVCAPGIFQMVFQDPYQSLDPLWNIASILNEALWHERGMSFEIKRDKMIQMLHAVGLSKDVLPRFPHEFSGGERQRIAIARAILANPKAIILDEAVSALDALVQKQIIDLLKKLRKDFNLSFLFISHNLRLVSNFSDKIAVMHQGKIIEQGLSSAILKSPQHPYTKELWQAAFYTD